MINDRDKKLIRLGEQMLEARLYNRAEAKRRREILQTVQRSLSRGESPTVLHTSLVEIMNKSRNPSPEEREALLSQLVP